MLSQEAVALEDDSRIRYNTKPMVIKVLSIAILFMLSLFAASSASATITLGGVGTVKAGDDYATNNFSDSWDMSNSEDVWPVYTNINSPSFSGGTFRGVAANSGPQVYFLWGGYPNSIASPRDGNINPINANYYNRMAIRFYSSVASKAQLYWFYSQDITKNRKWQQFNAKAGWNIYIFDAEHNFNAFASGWNGSPIGVRLGPVNTPGATFSVDWVNVYRANTSTALVSWDDNAPNGSAYKIYVDGDNSGYNGTLLTTAASSPATVDLSALRAGTYYLYVTRSGSANSAYVAVHVNDAPVVKVLDPDVAGGDDWASRIMGDSWNMSNSRDIISTKNLTRRSFRKGLYTAVNTGNDPIIYLNMRGKRINTTRYHRLTVKYKFNDSFNLVRGTMARVGWKNYPSRGWQMTDDLLTYEGWNTISQDLRGANLDVGRFGWRGWVGTMRFDPHEDPLARRFYVDSVRVTADDMTKNGRFNVRYRVGDTDSAAVSVQIYADPDTNPSNGNWRLIMSTTRGAGDGVFTWTPDASFNGRNNIYVAVSDGLNNTGSYSTGPLQVDTYRPRTYARKSVVKRKRNRRRVARYLKLYRANRNKVGKTRNRTLKKRYQRRARKYKRAYLKEKKGIARATFRWLVKDPYSQSEAKVKLKIKKRVKSKARAKKKSRYKRSYLAWKAKSRKTRNRTLKRRYMRAAKRYYKRYRRVKTVYYKTVKNVNYGWTTINRWQKYTLKTRNAGTYRYYVYAKDPAGNIQHRVSANWSVVK